MYLAIKHSPSGTRVVRTESSELPEGFVGPGEVGYLIVALDFQHPHAHQINPPGRNEDHHEFPKITKGE